MFAPFSRLALFLVLVTGWAGLFFGGWIAWRGLVLYERDPVLMGTGGGIALGGMLIVALSVGAFAQVSTARDTAAMRKLMEAEAARPRPRAETPATVVPLRSAPAPDAAPAPKPAAAPKASPVKPAKDGRREPSLFRAVSPREEQ